MASFGSGFAQGLNSGSALVNNIVNMNNSMKRSKMEQTLFNQSQADRQQKGELEKAYFQQAQKQQELHDLGVRNQQQQTIMDKFDNASPSDLTLFILDNFKKNGGKEDSQTLNLARGVATSLFDMKNSFKETQMRNEKFKNEQALLNKQINAPLSNYGKLAHDFNLPLTKESISKNPSLFGQSDSQTTDQKNYEFVKSQGYKGSFIDYKKELSKRVNPVTKTTDQKNYETAKSQGYTGSFMDYKKELNKKERTQTSTKLSKLIKEQSKYPKGSKEYNYYNEAIKLASKGKVSEIDKLAQAMGVIPETTPKSNAPFKEGTILEKNGKRYKVVNGLPVEQ